MAGLGIALLSLSIFSMLFRLNMEFKSNNIKDDQINILLRLLELNIEDLKLLKNLKAKAREEFIDELIKNKNEDLNILMGEVQDE